MVAERFGDGQFKKTAGKAKRGAGVGRGLRCLPGRLSD
jgi:hypothetical protein